MSLPLQEYVEGLFSVAVLRNDLVTVLEFLKIERGNARMMHLLFRGSDIDVWIKSVIALMVTSLLKCQRFCVRLRETISMEPSEAFNFTICLWMPRRRALMFDTVAAEGCFKGVRAEL